MAIKLSIYLKRTEQSVDAWLNNNNIMSLNEVVPKCAFLGLTLDADAEHSIKEAFKRKTNKQPQAIEKDAASNDDVRVISDVDVSMRKKRKKSVDEQV